MHRKALFTGIIAWFVLAFAAVAQEGHPLTGTWHGDRGGAAGAQRTRVVLFMRWENKQLVGTLNPGPNAVELKTSTLDPSNWTVHMEADTKDNMHVVIDGKLDNIGSYNRTITGTWTQGGVKGDLKLTRD
jgi:hypothetical protein